MVSIATWNVNSVKSRLPHLLEWLKRDKPDVVLLQELKCVNEAFPAMEVEELGYHLALHGEKTYNGVAVLSLFPLEDVSRGLDDDGSDLQSRYIETVISLPGAAMRVASVYVPNGQTADSDKFAYKLRFLERLRTRIANLLPLEEIFIIGGDYNIAPHDEDVHAPQAWKGSVLTHYEVRRRWREIEYLGMYDAFRLCHPYGQPAPPDGIYSWWDYRANGFARDDGLRIDHLLLSPQAADKLTACRVERTMRAAEKASDHAPVVGTFLT